MNSDPVEEIADPVCIQSYGEFVQYLYLFQNLIKLTSISNVCFIFLGDMKRFENNCINLSKTVNRC